MKRGWVSYDQNWLIELAKRQIPDKPEIITALKDCKKGFRESRAYIYFVNADNAGQPNSEWQFEENIILEDRKEGTIILDVLTDNRIGGIEFLKYVK